MSNIVSKEIIYVSDLEWKKDELEEIADISNNTYVRLKNKDISRIPLLGFNIYFHEDKWDFNKINNLHQPKNFYLYDFSDIHYAYKIYVKRLILQYLLNRLSFNTIYGKFRRLKKVIEYIIKKHIYDPKYITISIIESFCDELVNKDVREDYRTEQKRAFSDILKNIEYYNEDINFNDHYLILMRTNNDLVVAEIESGKTPNIPNDIFNLIISCCVSDIESIDTTFSEKMAASVILILSQVGMRIGELRLLESGKKQEITLFNGDQASKLEFKTYKTVRSKDFVWTKSFMTPLCIKAYNTLEKITVEKREKCKTKYLISSFRGNGDPYEIGAIRQMFRSFMAKHHKVIPCVNRNYEDVNGFTVVEISKSNAGEPNYINKKYKKELCDTDIIYVPAPHQFRVAVCNELIKATVDIEWVREHMNHITSDMTLHYKRKIEDENKSSISEKVIKGMVLKEFRPIGKEAELLIKKINEFVSENNYNIKTDLDTIVKELKGKVPIRQKKEGYCIKSAFGRKCPNNETLCAFGLCPNHIVNYQCIDITYKRFCDAVKIIKYNQENDYIKEAEMETNKLKKIIIDCLVPEIEELKYEVSRQGLESIKNNNRNIINIIENISTIEEEARKWII